VEDDGGATNNLAPVTKAGIIQEDEFTQAQESEERGEKHGEKQEVIVKKRGRIMR